MNAISHQHVISADRWSAGTVIGGTGGRAREHRALGEGNGQSIHVGQLHAEPICHLQGGEAPAHPRFGGRPRVQRPLATRLKLVEEVQIVDELVVDEASLALRIFRARRSEWRVQAWKQRLALDLTARSRMQGCPDEISQISCVLDGAARISVPESLVPHPVEESCYLCDARTHLARL